MPLPSVVSKPQWRVVAYAGAVLVLLPLLVLALSWNSLDSTIWNHLLETQMARLLGNTLVLAVGVIVGVVLLEGFVDITVPEFSAQSVENCSLQG